MSSKRQRKAGWILPTPHIPEEIELINISICIPDVREYKAAFWGSVYELGKWWNWEKSYTPGDTRAKEAAELWRYILYNFVTEGCNCEGGAGDDWTIINNVGDTTGTQDPPMGFDPEDPPTWNPALDPSTNPLLDGVICTAVKIMMREWEAVRYQAMLAECSGEDPNWNALGASLSSNIALTLAGFALYTVIPVPLILAAVAAAGTGLSFSAAEFAMAVTGGSDEACPPAQLPAEILDAYACCLYNHFTSNGFALSDFETMWDEPCQAAIDTFDILPQFPFLATLMDATFRSIFKSFTTSATMYRAFLELMSVVSNVPAEAHEDCQDCYDCYPVPESLESVPIFTDPRITVFPAPVLTTGCGGDQMLHQVGVAYRVTINEPYCIIRLQGDICRGATESKPDRLFVQYNGEEWSDGAGGFGQANFDVTLSERIRTNEFYYIVKPANAGGETEYRLEIDTYVRIVTNA